MKSTAEFIAGLEKKLEIAIGKLSHSEATVEVLVEAVNEYRKREERELAIFTELHKLRSPKPTMPPKCRATTSPLVPEHMILKCSPDQYKSFKNAGWSAEMLVIHGHAVWCA